MPQGLEPPVKHAAKPAPKGHGALLCTFLLGTHCTAPCFMQNNYFFAISAMNVDDIDTYSPGAVVHFQRSDG